MKKILTIGLLLITAATQKLSAQELELPQPSPWAQVSQKFGLAQATVTYSRPSMKGRTIFGSLVPYGEMWRTGANKATELKLEGNVAINGQILPAGAYSLFTIPGEKEWTVIINKNTELWGTGGYKQEEDAMRFQVKVQSHTSTESFTIGFSNIKDNSAVLEIYWETTMISFELTNDFLEQGKTNITEAIAAAENTMSLYNDAAEFYLDNNLDAKQALEWAKKSVAQRERYWNLFTLAKAYAKNGMNKEAIETAEKALTLSNEAKNTGFSQGIEKELNKWKSNK
ncbi:MAG TPA: DUF2911 domain-containing protein [Chitinophagales bacterium]|nr:DUF2911 domain-containing protein [Chitinophagales bacterium]HMU69661.1 DUF2911 domain-containing protein [Chitinophagales bacterium]HNA57142.1 DUF2911 domain-containing protein [Chitinophagales bacterium]HNE46733.1 DUF2911 domain-containing protein [Chitinophagales bacterium]HNF69056.1 DUF2911 domain-containing protein [Chitinophagales bacterium]